MLWLYDDPALANTPCPKQCTGALLLLPSLKELGAGMARLATLLQHMGWGKSSSKHTTLHVALTGVCVGGGVRGMALLATLQQRMG